MADQVTNYQCPNCGGPLHFDSETQKLKCDYCDSLFTPQEVETFYASANEQALNAESDQWEIESGQWTAEEAAHLKAYNCPSCGARIITDDHTGATSCPYCGNNQIDPAQFDGSYRPDYVLPFQLDKDAAVSRLKKFYQGKPLLPRAFTENNHIEEIKGVYVPFWLYNAKLDADMIYHATRTMSHREGDYQVSTTSHYQVARRGLVSFTRVPADASSKMPDEFMDAVEPFDYSKMVPFQMSYLAGYLADRYDVDVKEDQERANERMRHTVISAMSSTVTGYSSVVPERQHIRIVSGYADYAFLPVWVLSTRWNGKPYLFVMNGQSGKMIGDLPVDNGKFFLYLILIALVIFAVLFLLFGGLF